MNGFGFRIVGGQATRIDVDETLSCSADFVWTHLAATDETIQTWLRERAHLPDYVVDALTATETRPRCEPIEHGAFLNLRGRSRERLDGSDILASVRIWAVKGRVWSVTRAPLYAVGAVERDVERGEVRDPGDLITAYASQITADLDPQVAALGDELDDCEQALDERRIFELRRAVGRVRVEAIGYKRFMNPQRAALEKLALLPGDWLGDDDRLHISAAADRAARMAEELESIRERAALIHETLTDLRAEQLDSRGLTISVAAMVFLPLTFITGLYGMNVKGLPYADAPWAFDGVMAACTVIAVGIVAYFVQRHWFRR